LTLYWADGELALPRATKDELARQLVAHVAERYRAARG
jgi:phosphopantothenoylcysteine decarboxylase/phosphopantothenate--cysteine ligase